jgi:hypothetical protein
VLVRGEMKRLVASGSGQVATITFGPGRGDTARRGRLLPSRLLRRLHSVHQCAQSRVHLGRRQVHAVTMSGKDPLESVLTKPSK